MNGEDPLLLQTEKGLTARIGSILLYPLEDPEAYARKRAQAADIPPRTLVFVPSVGLGYGLRELVDRLPESSSVLCVETDQRIMALAAGAGLPMHPRLTVVRTDSEAAVCGVLEGMGPGNFRRVVGVPLSAGYRLDRGRYDAMREALSSEIRSYWQNRMTLIGMGSLYVRNLFDNLFRLPRSGDLSELITEKPVVVCGAGPSLDAGIPMLLRLRGRYLLAAVDTALPALASAGLRPDLIVTLEAQHANLADFLPFRDPSVPVVCDLVSCPAVLRLSPRSLFFFSSAFAPIPLLDRLKARGILPSPMPALGSVGVAAAFAVLHASRGPVFLTGLDLSFPDGRTHARGVPSHIATLASSGRFRGTGQEAYAALQGRPLVRARDKNGSTVRTDLTMSSYRDGLENVLRPENSRVLDFGGTGLPLGIRHVGIKEAEEALSAARKTGGTYQRMANRAEDRGDVCAFIADEKRALSAADSLITEAIASADPAGTVRDGGRILRDVDYAYLHFPDFPSGDVPADRGFLARALIAVRYYSGRLGRIPA